MIVVEKTRLFSAPLLRRPWPFRVPFRSRVLVPSFVLWRSFSTCLTSSISLLCWCHHLVLASSVSFPRSQNSMDTFIVACTSSCRVVGVLLGWRGTRGRVCCCRGGGPQSFSRHMGEWPRATAGGLSGLWAVTGRWCDSKVWGFDSVRWREDGRGN